MPGWAVPRQKCGFTGIDNWGELQWKATKGLLELLLLLQKQKQTNKSWVIKSITGINGFLGELQILWSKVSLVGLSGAQPFPQNELIENHRMVWVGKDFWRSSCQPALQWTGTASSAPGCSKPHMTWPWIFPGMECFHLSGQPVPMPHPPHCEKLLPYA